MEKQTIKEIDLTQIAKKIHTYRKWYIGVVPVAIVLTIICAFVLPRYYRCDMKLSPESGERFGADLALLSNAFGIRENIETDAISPMMYPDIISSLTFAMHLLEMPVSTIDGRTMDLGTYRQKIHRDAPLKRIYSSTLRMLRPNKGAAYQPDSANDIRYLSLERYELIRAINSDIRCTISKRTGIVDIQITEQDPLVAMQVSEEVLRLLQSYVTEYRTEKARKDYISYLQMCQKAETDYLNAQVAYANYTDTHIDAHLQATKNEQERLRQEVNRKLNAFTALVTQVLAAQTKIQEATPVFSIIQGAYLPPKPAGPRKLFMLIGMLVLCTIVTTIVVLTRK